jgi:hypothetical protein
MSPTAVPTAVPTADVATAAAPGAANVFPNSVDQEENTSDPDESSADKDSKIKQDEKDRKESDDVLHQKKNKAIHVIRSIGEQSKESDDDANTSKTSSVSKAHPTTVPGVEYIDSEVLPPRREQSIITKSASQMQKSDISDDHDAKLRGGAGIQSISSTNSITRGRDPTMSEKLFKHPVSATNRACVRTEDMEVATSSSANNTALARHQEDIEIAQIGEENLFMVVATEVVSKPMPLVTAVATKNNDNRKLKLFAIGACLVVVALVVGLAVAFSGGSGGDDTTETEVTQDTFFDKIGGPIDGTVRDGHYGVSVATDRNGSRIAAADLFGLVDVYELMEEVDSPDWEMLGSTIQAAATTNDLSDTTSEQSKTGESHLTSHTTIRAPTVTAMSMDGSVVAVGWPVYEDHENGDTSSIGLVEVYRYFQDSLSWEQQGNSLFGKLSGDMFGASLSLSEDGSTLVVGAVGNDSAGYAEVYVLDLDSDSDASWNQLGGTMTGVELELDIFSVALSNDGATLCVGGIPTHEEDAPVAKVFHWFDGNWEELGSGIDGRLLMQAIGETIYLADLSGDGNTVVISNYYTADARENTGKGLYVRAFTWSADSGEWEHLGQNMHTGYTAEKSGYFVSVSEDGRTIGMGDPGARVEGHGAVAGHAHFFVFQEDRDEWIQAGHGERIWSFGHSTVKVFGKNGSFQFLPMWLGHLVIC